MVNMESSNGESSIQNNHKIELITFDFNRNLQYPGICKIRCNRLSQCLNVEPINEELKMITALFKWKFIIKKNILFIFGEKEFQDFALIFDEEFRCKKVYNFIFKKRVKDTVEDEIFHNRFLNPFNNVLESIVTNERLKKLINSWIEKQSDHEINQDCLTMINENESQAISANTETQQSRENNVSDDIERNQRKRKRCGNKHTKIIQQSDFKILNFKTQTRLQRQLIIFTSPEKTHCIHFIQKKYDTYFRCLGCTLTQRRNTAYLLKDENDDDYIKLNTSVHQCKEIPYIPEDYVELKYVRKPNFEIFTNAENKAGKMLVVLNENDANFCYEFYWSATKQSYYCCGCQINRKRLAAKIYFDKNEEEYLEMDDIRHVCEPRKYDKEKYQKPYNFVLKPNFEIRKEMKDDGSEKQYLIILDSENKNKCYKYFHRNANTFSCIRCHKNGRYISAKLHKNDENEEYVILSNAEHICELLPYIENTDEKVLYPPAFKFMETTSTGVPKIFIFALNNKKMCYVFHRVFRKENRYICSGCHDKPTKENTVFDEFGKKLKGVVYVYLCKDSEGKHFVKLPNHEHICEPKEFKPEKYETLKRPKRKPLPIDKNKILKKPNFELQKNLKGDPKGRLIVFVPNDRNLCYEYCLTENFYFCGRCRSRKVHVSARLYPFESSKNGEEEYIVLGSKNHRCEPVKYEQEKWQLVDPSDYMIFFQNDKNKLTKIILFTSPSKEYCYEFTWHQTAKHYFCYPCKSMPVKKHVVGRLVKNENGIECFELSTQNEHSCAPKKFDLEKYEPKTIPESRFELGSNIRGKPNSKLYLFTSDEKDYFYEYYSTRLSHFICLQCITIDKSLYVKAKLVENENGEKCLELDSKEHICQPKKSEKKRIDNFQLLHNKFGIPKIQLITFDQNDQQFGYEFTMFKGASAYTCRGCISEKKKYISAKLCTDKSGKEFVKMGETEHVCKIRNFLKTGKIVKDFVLKEDENGNQIIISNHPSNKNSAYKFIFDSEAGGFRCQKCKEDLQRFVTATICTDKDGCEFLLLNDKHFCTPFLK